MHFLDAMLSLHQPATRPSTTETVVLLKDDSNFLVHWGDKGSFPVMEVELKACIWMCSTFWCSFSLSAAIAVAPSPEVWPSDVSMDNVSLDRLTLISDAYVNFNFGSSTLARTWTLVGFPSTIPMSSSISGRGILQYWKVLYRVVSTPPGPGPPPHIEVGRWDRTDEDRHRVWVTSWGASFSTWIWMPPGWFGVVLTDTVGLAGTPSFGFSSWVSFVSFEGGCSVVVASEEDGVLSFSCCFCWNTLFFPFPLHLLERLTSSHFCSEGSSSATSFPLPSGWPVSSSSSSSSSSSQPATSANKSSVVATSFSRSTMHIDVKLSMDSEKDSRVMALLGLSLSLRKEKDSLELHLNLKSCVIDSSKHYSNSLFDERFLKVRHFREFFRGAVVLDRECGDKGAKWLIGCNLHPSGRVLEQLSEYRGKRLFPRRQLAHARDVREDLCSTLPHAPYIIFTQS